MKVRGLGSYLFTLLCYVTVVSAIFFTDSKDNDYPRIGKRLLPSSVYKTWLAGNEEIEYMPYVYQTRTDNAVKQLIAPRTNARFYHEINDYGDPTERGLPERLPDKRLYRKIMTYLTSEDDLNF